MLRNPYSTTRKPSPVDTAGIQAQFAEQIGLQVYTDLAGAKRLLLQLRSLIAEQPEHELTAQQHLIAGNIANLEYAFDTALTELSTATKLARDTGDKTTQLEAGIDRVGPLLNLNLVSEAAQLIDELHGFSGEVSSSYHWRIHTREGFVHLRLGALDDALTSFAKAKKTAPTFLPESTPVKDAYYGALLYAGLGRVYSTGGDLPRAIDAYEHVVQLCSAFHMRARLPYHYLDLGRAHMTNDNRTAAVANFREAIESAGTHDKPALAAALANLGYYAFQDEDWVTATRHFDEAEHHYRTANTPASTDLSMIHVWKARMARKQQRDAAAEQALITSLQHAQAGGASSQLAEVYAEIADYYASRGGFEDAYAYRLRYEEVQREVDEAARQQVLSELELRSEVEQRRRETELLHLRAARLQLKALRAQMNPHFIFNALNAIQEFIVAERATEAAAHLAHFARLMRQSLDYSEREVITLEEEVEFLDNYLKLNQKLRFRDEFTYAVSIDEALEEDIIGLPAMLVQPYVENALEHGIRLVPRGHVQIEFAAHPENEDMLIIHVQDNGIGRERAAAQISQRRTGHKSMGTAITKHRLELLNTSSEGNAAITYTDLLDSDGSAAGTLVTLQVPISWQVG